MSARGEYGAAMTTQRPLFAGMPGLIRVVAVLGIGAGVLTAPGPVSAEKSGSLRLGGQVIPYAAFRASRWTLDPVSLQRSPAGNRVAVAGLALLANNRQFTVTLRSLGAIVTGRPSLIDPATGRRLSYGISFGGAALDFSRGELNLDDALAVATGQEELEVKLPDDARLRAGQFQDRLVLVITAR